MTGGPNTLSLGSVLVHGVALGGNVDNVGEANNQKLTIDNLPLSTTGDVLVTRGALDIGGNSNVNIGGQLTQPPGPMGTYAWNSFILRDTASLTVAGGIDFNNIASNLAFNGGTLTTPSIWGNTYNNGSSRTVFNGTRIIASQSNPSFLQMSDGSDGGTTTGIANIANGGAIFDTNGFDIGVAPRLADLPGHSGPLTKLGAGTLSLSGVNTYTGGTTIDQGTLNITADYALGTAPGSPATNLTFSGNGTLQAGATTVVLAPTRNVSIESGVTATLDTNGNDMVVSGVIGGASAAGLVKTGAGTLVLGGANTYVGSTEIQDGTLQLGTPSSGSAPAVQNASFEAPALSGGGYVYYGSMSPSQQTDFVWTGAGNGTGGPALQSNGSAWGYQNVPDGTQGVSLQRDSSVTQTLNFTEAGLYTLSWSAARRGGQLNPYVVQLDGTTLGSFSAAGNAWQPASIPFYVTAAGNHTLRFAGTHTASDQSVGIDDLTLAGSTLNGSLPSTTAVTISGASAVLDLNGRDQTIASLAGVPGSGVALGGGTLTINPASGSTEFEGSISGSGGVTKMGAGTQVFSGPNTYTGTTEVSGGTLLVDGTLHGDVSVLPGGTLSAGSSPGHMIVTDTSSYTQSGTMLAELGGLLQGTEYDWIEVDGGAAAVSGLIDILLVDGFQPATGATFDVLTATGGVIDGGLSLNWDSAQLSPAQYWKYSIEDLPSGGQALRLELGVPEPASLGLLALGTLVLAGLGPRRGRRRRP